MRRKIHVIFIAGIRSQYMKVVSIQNEFGRLSSLYAHKITPIYINCGQHYDYNLSQIFIEELGIKFDYTITYKSKSPLDILSEMTKKLSNILLKINQVNKIDWVTVFGDANTTLVGSIVSSRLKLPLIHIESGVRTGDKQTSEEINRIVADHIAKVHFVSSKSDLNNLAKENINESVIWSGDVIFDLVKHYSKMLPVGLPNYVKDDYIICTIHREENLDKPKALSNILQVLENYSRPVIFITHPRTAVQIKKLKRRDYNNIDFIPVLKYKELLSAIMGCSFIVTDSGALQRESYYLGKRCLICQERPFWKSLTQAKIHKVFDPEIIEFNKALKWIEKYKDIPYNFFDDLGLGNACETIFNNILKLSS